MPNYDYKCSCSNEHTFERLVPIEDRDKPCQELCPCCGAPDSIKRVQGCGKMVYETKDVIDRAGSQFKEIQSKIVEYTGKKHHNMRLK